MRAVLLICVATLAAPFGLGEELLREGFDAGPVTTPPLVRTWGDTPARVEVNAVEPGPEGTPAAHLRAVYPEAVPHKLSYWTYRLPTPLPLCPSLQTISFRVKTNAPVSIKIGLSPFGFIYHGPGVPAADGSGRDAAERLRRTGEMVRAARSRLRCHGVGDHRPGRVLARGGCVD